MNPHPAVEVVRTFIDAILWGEHLRVWELLSERGRANVLDAGERRGLDAVKAARIRQGSAAHGEMEAFLTELLQGLRIDFSTVDLAQVGVALEVEEVSEDRVQVALVVPATFGDEAWAAGSVELSRPLHEWLVERVHPLVSRS